MSPDTLFQALDRAGPVARIALTGLAHRGELAALEAGEARDHLAGSLALGVTSAALAILGGFAVNLALAAAIWHRDDRGLILGAVAAAQLLIAGIIGFLAARRLRDWRPLAETRRQLREDCDCLQNALPGDDAESSP